MVDLLVKLMIATAIAQLGLSAKYLLNPQQMVRATRQVAKFKWKPLSVFPKEAARFR